MINKEVSAAHVLQALDEIDRHGVPKRRQATKYNLYHNGKSYPPKYVVWLGIRYATGQEVNPRSFLGGDETNSFLSSLGFTIREGSSVLQKKA